MFNSQLFFFVAITLISVDAQAHPTTSLRSADDSWKFEVHLALNLTRYAVKKLEDVPDKPGKTILAKAEKLIAAVLNETNPTEIVDGLMRVLKAELKAFARVNDGCLRPKSHTTISELKTCKAVCAVIRLSMQDLMDAIIEVETIAMKKTKLPELRKTSRNKNTPAPL